MGANNLDNTVKRAGRARALTARLFDSRGAEARDISLETYPRFLRLGDPDKIENPEACVFRIASHLLWERKLGAETGLSACHDERGAVRHPWPRIPRRYQV